MFDLKKPRLTEKGNKYELLFGYEPLYARLQELENAIEDWELAPVVRGEWMNMCDNMECDPIFVCSNCKETWILNYGNPSENNMNYCPNCGAKMDGKDGE